MEELIPMLPKIIELGVLGICNVFLIVKGVHALNNLTTVVEKLVVQVDAMDKKYNALEHILHDIRKTLDRVERRLEYENNAKLKNIYKEG